MPEKFWIKYKPQLQTLFILLLAASVRLTQLGIFRAVDEEDRWAWAVDFYNALLAGNLPNTLVGDGYPGIFPAWLETAWFFAGSVYGSVMQGSWLGEAGIYAQLHDWGRWSNLPLQRFPIAMANTVLVVVIFWYVRKIFNARVALLAAVFISLDPFLLSDSRVNRAEALLAGLMTVSLLALVFSLQQDRNNRQYRTHFVVSAVVAGLAVLTKLQALVLWPMFGVIALVWLWVRQDTWRHAVRPWLVWFLGWSLLATLTFCLLWPAVWTVPADTFALMTKFLTRKVGEEGVKIFFLGRTVLNEDPGLLYYPVIFILRITPLTLFGLLVGLWYSAADFRFSIDDLRGRSETLARIKAWAAPRAEIWALAGYVLLYVGGMSLGSHKQDRFLMAVFPALGILAALGWQTLVERLPVFRRRYRVTLAGFTVLGLLTALPYHPYYFSYFNPLVGGGPTAVRLTRIGWGEGMDQVASYLNTLDNPQELKVAARFYKYLLGFEGEAINLDVGGDWVRADKIVFYIQQSQRRIDPSPGVIDYFQQHIPPEKTITINGIEYAQIYPNPIRYPAEPTVARADGVLALFGYRWQPTASGAIATLVTENLAGESPAPAVRLHLTDEYLGEWFPCDVRVGFEAAAKIEGGVVEYECALDSAGLSPGLYSLQVGLPQPGRGYAPLNFAGGQAAIQVTADGALNRVSADVAFAQLADRALPAEAVRLARAFDYDVQLLGYTLVPQNPHPGDALTLTLYWQSTEPRELPADISVQAFAGDTRIVMVNQPTTIDIREWLPGQVTSDTVRLPLPANLPAPVQLRLDVGLFNPDTLTPYQVRNLEGVDIPGEITRLSVQPPHPIRYTGDHPLDFTFGQAIRLTGADISRDGQTLNVTLYWQSLAPLSDNYTVFVHLVASDGALVAQSDVLPANGNYPTSVWQPGNTVQSFHQLDLPTDLPVGKYTLLAGMYRPGDWMRLPAVDGAGNTLPDDLAIVGLFEKGEE